MTPIASMDEMREALVAGLTVHRVQYQAGAPFRFKRVMGNHKIDFAEHRYLADHACGGQAISAASVEVPREDPQKAPVGPGRPVDGFHRLGPSANASQGHTAARRARYATPHHSEHERHCDYCGEKIKDGENVIIRNLPGRTWAVHVHCPQNSVVSDWDAMNQLMRRNLNARHIETVQLPLMEDG